MQEFENSPPSDHEQSMPEISLPSGESIDVVSFEDSEKAAPELHICPDCSCDLVYPVAWEEADETSWAVRLRCPNCEWRAAGVFGEDAVLRFDEKLDHGTQELVSDLRQLTRANMEEDVERFALAISAGHVLPEDF